MKPTTADSIHCKQCHTLLMVREPAGLCAKRSGLELLITGTQFTVSVTCYGCRALNVVSNSSSPQPLAHRA